MITSENLNEFLALTEYERKNFLHHLQLIPNEDNNEIIFDDDSFQQFCIALSQCANLQSLVLTQFNLHLLTQKHLLNLSFVIFNYLSLMALNLSACQLEHLEMEQLNAFFSFCHTHRPFSLQQLALLDLHLKNIEPLQLSALGSALSTCPIQRLYLKNCQLEHLTSQQLIELFVHSQLSNNLQRLELGGFDFGILDHEKATALSYALSGCNQLALYNPKLTFLNDPNAINYLEIFLDNYRCLQQLDLQLHGSLLQLNENGFQVFFTMLSKYHTLEKLDISYNDLSSLNDIQFQVLCTALTQCHHLESLSLVHTNLSNLNEVQFQAFCNMLQACYSLQVLNLSYNNLGNLNEVQFQAFCNMLQACDSLQVLNLSHNNLGNLSEVRFHALGNALKNSHINTLDLSDNALDNLNLNETQIHAWLENTKIIEVAVAKTKDDNLWAIITSIRWQNFTNEINCKIIDHLYNENMRKSIKPNSSDKFNWNLLNILLSYRYGRWTKERLKEFDHIQYLNPRCPHSSSPPMLTFSNQCQHGNTSSHNYDQRKYPANAKKNQKNAHIITIDGSNHVSQKSQVKHLAF